MARPQFTLRALLVAMLVVAAFFGGMAVQRRLGEPQSPAIRVYPLVGAAEILTLSDGTNELRPVSQPIEIDGK